MDLERLKIDRTRSTPPRRRGGRRGFGRILLLLIVLGAAYVFRSPLTELVDRLRLPTVSVVLVSRTSALAASAVSGTAANGYVVARHRAALSADTPGRVVEMNVEEGSVVKKGAVVARLYSAEYEAELRRTEAELETVKKTLARTQAELSAAEARMLETRSSVDAEAARLEEAEAAQRLAVKEHARAERLLETRVDTQQRLDNAIEGLERSQARVNAARATKRQAESATRTAETGVTVARASVEETAARVVALEAARDQAEATLSKTEVRAPFDGVVVMKDAEVGEVVSPNSMGGNSRGSVVTMVDFDSLEVQVELPETSLAAVSIGTPADVYLDAFPDRRYTGRVDRIWPTANRQKATIEVRVTFDETDELLRPEMGARVVFSPTGPKDREPESETPADCILLPQNCIVQIAGQPGVFALERDVARFREVRLGGESSDRVLIEEGLSGGERVVVDPPLSLADGDRVRMDG